jgi:hypothetical protein
MKNEKFSEFTANVAMAQAGFVPASTAKIGRNFAKPIPRLAMRKEKNSFLVRLIAFGKTR